mgnify:CR=1 FL=1
MPQYRRIKYYKNKRKKSNVALENMAVLVIVAILVSGIMIASFIVALTRFSTNDPTASSVAESSEVSIEVSVEESSEVPEVSTPDYDYYDGIEYTEITIDNKEISNGSLAIVKNGGSVPTIDTSKTAGVHEVMTPGVYGLKDYSLKAYTTAIKGIDQFIVNFYNAVPNNGLIIGEALISASGVSSENGSIDLTSGYSFLFSIHRSSYSFSDPAFQFLREQSYRYGVVQRYPADKKQYTGFEENLKIYRYVGIEHSYYMNYYNLCLEEYIDKITTERVIEFRSGLEDNTAYVIYYVPADTTSSVTKVPVPSDERYTYNVSGDGSKGFVVSVDTQGKVVIC